MESYRLAIAVPGRRLNEIVTDGNWALMVDHERRDFHHRGRPASITGTCCHSTI